MSQFELPFVDKRVPALHFFIYFFIFLEAHLIYCVLLLNTDQRLLCSLLGCLYNLSVLVRNTNVCIRTKNFYHLSVQHALVMC